MKASTITRRPVTFVIVLALVIIFAGAAATVVAHVVDLPAELVVVLADAPLALAGLIVLARRGGLQAAGIQPRPWARAFTLSAPLFLPTIVTLALALHFGGSWAPGRVLVFALLALLAGLTEEVLFRGLGYSALRRLGVTRAVFGSALVFGLMHLVNLTQGAAPLNTALQAVYAFALGCAFAAALEAGGRLLPLIAAHAGTDLFGFIADGGIVNSAGQETLTATITALYIIVFGSYTVWVLRRPGRAALAA